MSFLWLVVLFVSFNRSYSENAAGNPGVAVLYPKNENLFLEGSINVNGTPALPALLPSKYQESKQNSQNGGLHVEPARQPLDTEGEFQAKIYLRSQNERKWRELNSWLNWRWTERGYQNQRQQQLHNSHQQQPQFSIHRRWRQQQPPFFDQQQHYRWHQQAFRNTHQQYLVQLRRQNAINQGMMSVLDRFPQNQRPREQQDLNPVEQTTNWAQGMFPPSQGKHQNSATVEQLSTSKQKLAKNINQQSENQVNRLQNLWNAKNKAPSMDIKNSAETPKTGFDSRLFGQGQQIPLSSTSNPPVSSKPQMFVNQVDQEPSIPEADESTESYWRRKDLYPMWKPPLSGFGIFAADVQTARRKNVPLKGQGIVKPFVQPGVQSDRQPQNTINIQHEIWVFGLKFSIKKANRDQLEPEKEFSEQKSQPVGAPKPNFTFLRASALNKSSDQQKPASNIFKPTGSMTHQTRANAQLQVQKLQRESHSENTKTNQTIGSYTTQNPALKDINPLGPTLSTNAGKLNHQVPKSHDSFLKKSLPPGSAETLPNVSVARHVQEQIKLQEGQNTTQPSSTQSGLSSQPLLPRPVFSTESSGQMPVQHEAKEIEKTHRFGLQGGQKIKPRNIGHPSNSQGHSVSGRFEQSQAIQSKLVETEKNLNTSDHKNASTNPQYTVNPHIRQAVVFNEDISAHQFNSSVLHPEESNREPTFSDWRLGRKYLTFRQQFFKDPSENRVKLVHAMKKRTIDSRGTSPMETDNQRLSNMESLGGPMNIDPYEFSLQNTDPSKSAVDMELSSNEVEYLFQAIKNGMRLLANKVMGYTK